MLRFNKVLCAVNLCGVFGLLGLSLTAITGSARAGEPIYLQPGQCILVGGQQVCAMQVGQAAEVAKPDTLYVCRYGVHAGSEVPDMKTYALFMVRLDPSGHKTETLVKNYGVADSDKTACDSESERRQAAQK